MKLASLLVITLVIFAVHIVGYLYGLKGEYVSLSFIVSICLMLNVVEKYFKRSVARKLEVNRRMLEVENPEYLKEVETLVYGKGGWKNRVHNLCRLLLGSIVIFLPPMLYTLYIDESISINSSLTSMHIIMMLLGVGILCIIYKVFGRQAE
ncbi:hypothetical protein L1077_26895 [Pseudoalteromonas luteoviolacea]|uniref:hypothetical protein n=1 Tax=Pseudoalteromonas luteoviolacea TaxID=43657 RepID=UPI001F194B72|nr:hypothetical protein [Pseudoalteromonas luteoviolacea]MCF6443058.1 hypothetical protein [Pseudoalteromonas luteoviolacea]